MARDFSAAQGSRQGHWRWAWAVSGGLALHFVRCTGWGLCQGHKGRKRRKRQGSMAEWGLWPVIFQQHRAPGGAMWRWAAWYTHILCNVLCVLYVLIRPFPGSQYRLCTLCIANQPYLFSERIRYIFSRKPPFFKKFSSSA